MAKVLYIKANPKSDTDSVTFQMSEKFMEEYKKQNPDDEIITLDLYKENIRFLTAQDLDDMYSGADFDIRRYAEQFANADKYVIAAPFWNLSMPAILKGYIDYVTFAGVTFKYTEQGSVGLLAGKKAMYITARGGVYTIPETAQYEMGERYLKTVLGFMGIVDMTTLLCENTNVLQGDDRKNAVTKSVEDAGKAAQMF